MNFSRLQYAGDIITSWLIEFVTIFSILARIGMLKKNMTPKVNKSTDLHLWLVFDLMSQDVGNENNSWESISNAKIDEFEIRTGLFLFRSRKSSHSILRMIHLLLVLLYPMTKAVIVILLLNFHMQNQREISLRMSHQQRRKSHFHRRQLKLLHREHQCHRTLLTHGTDRKSVVCK